ncbi:cyclic-di-AMP receptor [Eubacteriales bacterium OttesenSCG-928-M02]|nr:cyclic-di-AMP receptor [Eubacteriales bacterium OttesenSCG-928-M02]
MKLIFAIIQKEDARALTGALVERGFSVTQVSSAGGFLRGGNATMMIGVEDGKVEEVLSIIQAESHSRTMTQPILALPELESIPIPIEVKVGGATVFVVNAEGFYKY